MKNEELRYEIKALKAFNNISYKSLSEELGIKQKSFYGWLKGDFNLSDDNQKLLTRIVNLHKGGS